MRLGPAIDLMLKRHDYPEAVSKLVAEAVTLAALLGSTLKTSGRFQLQTKSDGPVSMLLVDFARRHIYARWLASTKRALSAGLSLAAACSARVTWPSPSITP